MYTLNTHTQLYINEYMDTQTNWPSWWYIQEGHEAIDLTKRFQSG